MSKKKRKSSQQEREIERRTLYTQNLFFLLPFTGKSIIRKLLGVWDFPERKFSCFCY